MAPMEKLLFQVMMAVSDFILRKDLGSPSPAHVCEEAINPKPRKEYSGSYSPPSMKSPCESWKERDIGDEIAVRSCEGAYQFLSDYGPSLHTVEAWSMQVDLLHLSPAHHL